MAVPLARYLTETRCLVLDEIQRIVPRRERCGPILYDLMLDYPMRNAKALRPALCVATCRALGGRLQAVLPTAAVLELYHNAFLIHDDVEDGSELRRSGPTLHKMVGIPAAINVGDAMLAMTLKPLLNNMQLLGMGPALRILRTVERMAVESAEGQAIELDWIRKASWSHDDDSYVDMVKKKTAWYTFAAPMMLGAIIGRADAEKIDALQKFAMDLGVAFQIQDDVLNLDGLEDDYGKEIGGDLWEGKHTLILLHALRCANDADRARAIDVLSRPRPLVEGTPTLTLISELAKQGHVTTEAVQALSAQLIGERPKTQEGIDFLFRLIRQHGSLEYARDVARRHAQAAERQLDAMNGWLGGSTHSEVLAALVCFVVGRGW